METEQPPAVNATTASIEDPQTAGTPTNPSTDKVQTTPPSETAVEMEQPKEDLSINESLPVVHGVQINDAASVCAVEKVSKSVECAQEQQQLVAQMECNAAATVNPALEQESPMDCQVSAVPETLPEETTGDREHPAPTITIPQVQPAPEAAAAGAASASGLSLLAAYTSDAEDSDVEEVTQIHDSDNEVVEVPVTGSAAATSTTAYRRPVVAVSSGSDSSDSSSSSDSDSDSEGEYLTVLRKKIDKRINTEECDEDDEDEEEGGATGDKSRRRQPPKVRGEMLLDELPPIHQLEITVPEDECVELGKVQSIVDQLVLVSVLPNSQLFDLDTVLFLEKGRKVLGEVFDVLGQVADPLYCVRFNSNQQILDRGIKIGDVVYCAPKTEHTQFVILSKLMQVRGSDASWEHDVEPPARYVDYSDDEEEREARNEQRKRRQRDRTNSTDSVDTVTTEASSVAAAAAPPPRQLGRRGQRESFRQNQRPQIAYRPDQNQNQNHGQQQPMDQQYSYHPSYNPGSWHSNYSNYHNYHHHQPPANFNMPPPQPGMHFPVPNYGYPMPYAAVPPHMMPPPHMYPPPSSAYGPPPPSHPRQGHPGPPS